MADTIADPNSARVPTQGQSPVHLLPTNASESDSQSADATDNDDEDDGDEEEGSSDSDLSDGGDFKEELEGVLQSFFSFRGTFAFGNVFPQAPNPVLSIDGIGQIGLPLSERDAFAIIEKAQQAPFGHNQETVVDTRVRDTFEIEAAKVHFVNPQFEKWLNTEIVPTVASQLGTLANDTKLELYKLLLYRERSHFKKHQDTAKSPGMFATVVIVLPSLHTGGELVLSHSNASKIFDFSPHSLLETIVMAWYTDVFHEVKPVLNGFRLALSFNLIRSTESRLAIPRLSDMDSSIEELRMVLRRWKAGKFSDTCNDKVAYMLSHQYSESELSRGEKALKGGDAHLISYVRDTAEELGFVLALGNLELQVSGQAEDTGYRCNYYKRRRGWYDDSEDDEADADDVEMIEEDNRELSVTALYDLDGRRIASVTTIEDEDLIPADYFNGVEPDRKEYEGYMGNYAGSLDHYYHSTALIIGPEDMVDFSCDVKASYALRQLAKSSTAGLSTPTAEDRSLAYSLLLNLKTKDQADQLIGYSLKWKDLGLWEGVFRRSATLATLARMIEGWKLFGWDAINPRLGGIVLGMKDLTSVINFLSTLPQHASAEERPKVQGWCNAMRRNHLTKITRATAADVPHLFAAIRQYGIKWFDESVFPNLAKDDTVDYNFWVNFVKKLWDDRATLLSPSNESARAEFTVLLEKTLTLALTKPRIDFMTLYSTAIQSYGPAWFEQRILPSMVKDNTQVEFFHQLWQELWSLRERAIGNAAPNYDSLVENVTVISLKMKCSDQQIPLLIKAIQANGTPWFNDRIFDIISKADDMYTFWLGLTTSLLDKNIGTDRPDEPPSSEPSKSVIHRCLEVLTSLWDMQVTAPAPRPYYGYYSQQAVTKLNSVERIVEIVNTCVRAKHPELCTPVFVAMLKKRPMTKENFTAFYEDFVRDVAHIKDIDICSPPFNRIMEVLIGAYLQNVLGSRPGNALSVRLRNIGCTCANCALVNNFLTNLSETTTFSINKPPRVHVCSYMDRVRDLVTYTVASYGRPTPVTVRKTPALMAYLQWAARQQKARAFLKSIGGDDVLVKVVGRRYTDVLRAVEGSQPFRVSSGQVIAQPQPAPQAQASSAASTSSTAAGVKRKQNVIGVIDLTKD